MFAAQRADDGPGKGLAVVACLLVTMACLPVIVGQMQINPQPRIGPSGGGSMRYSNTFVQTKALPSESRGYAMASGMMGSEHRYARSVAGNLPSAGRYAHLTPSLTSYGQPQAQWARRPNYGSLRQAPTTSYGQSLPWRQRAPASASPALSPASGNLLGSGSRYTTPRRSTFSQNRAGQLGSGGWGTIGYR